MEAFDAVCFNCPRCGNDLVFTSTAASVPRHRMFHFNCRTGELDYMINSEAKKITNIPRIDRTDAILCVTDFLSASETIEKCLRCSCCKTHIGVRINKIEIF